MRGDVHDGRGFVKAFFGGEQNEKPKGDTVDLDLDIRLGAIAGHNGEALRGVDLQDVPPRNGQIRTFGSNQPSAAMRTLTGDIRAARAAKQRDVFRNSRCRCAVPLHRHLSEDSWRPDVGRDGSADARSGAAGRHAQYPRLHDPRRSGARPRRRGAPQARHSRRRFLPHAGRVHPHARTAAGDGRRRAGPTVGATIDGHIDFAKNEVRMRGTFVPLYGSTMCSGRFRWSGCSSAAATKACSGITYEVVGPPSAPTLRVNPISAVAPGLLRKFFEFPNAKPAEPFEARTCDREHALSLRPKPASAARASCGRATA